MTIARQRCGKHVPAAKNRRGNRRTVRGGGLSSVPPSYERESFVNSFGGRRKRIQKLSVQLRSVNQQITEAEEVTDS
jgi:hypothetical protein